MIPASQIPADFTLAAAQGTVSSQCFIVQLFNGQTGDNFWLSNRAMAITYGGGSIQVEPLLQSWSGATISFDFITMEAQPKHCTINIIDVQNRKRSGTYSRVRFSDEWARPGSAAAALGSIWGAGFVNVYWFPGGHVTSIDSSMLVFSGMVQGFDKPDESTLVLSCDEIESPKPRNLPQRFLDKTTFPKAPVENVGVALPLVYGPHNELPYLKNTGAALGMRIDDWKWLVADHQCTFYSEPRPGGSAGNAAWIYIDALKSWARSYAGVTFNGNDGGRGTVDVTPTSAAFDVYLYPGRYVPTSSGTDGANPVGGNAAWDFSDTTKVSVIANSTTQAECVFEWYQHGSDSDDEVNNDVANLSAPSTQLSGLDMQASKPGGVTITSSTLEWWDGSVWTTFGGTIDVATANMIHYEEGILTGNGGAKKKVVWHLSTGGTGGDGTPLKVRLRFNGSGWTANTTVVAYVHEIRIMRSIRFPNSARPGVKASRRGGFDRGPRSGIVELKPQQESIQEIGASINGRQYGSWIDNGGRSNSLNAGDQIAHAPGIIESLLRDELGYTNIDEASFDVLYNTGAYGCVWSLPPGSQQDSKSILDRFCYEHSLLLFRRLGSGQIVIRAFGGGLLQQIDPQDMIGSPTFALTPAANRVNQLKIDYRRLDMDNDFFSHATYDDTTMQALQGVIPDSRGAIRLETIANIASVNIQERLLGSYALLSRGHFLMALTTRGGRFLNLELGDVINIDASDLTESFSFGVAFNTTRNFMIYEHSITADGNIAFKTVELDYAAV